MVGCNSLDLFHDRLLRKLFEGLGRQLFATYLSLHHRVVARLDDRFHVLLVQCVSQILLRSGRVGQAESTLPDVSLGALLIYELESFCCIGEVTGFSTREVPCLYLLDEIPLVRIIVLRLRSF